MTAKRLSSAQSRTDLCPYRYLAGNADWQGISPILIGDGVPLVEVALRPGREPARKKSLVDTIAEILNDTMGVEAGDGYVLFRENPAKNHCCRGRIGRTTRRLT